MKYVVFMCRTIKILNSNCPRMTKTQATVKGIDLRTSRAQIFSRARSPSGRFFLCFLRQKRARKRKLRAEANYRNWKWEAKDFEKVYYRHGRQLFLTSRHGQALITFYIQFLCADWSKFETWVHVERKIYAASWISLTLTAEGDRDLCHLVMFLTVFFHWMYRMKLKSLLLFMASLFIGFLVEKYVACQSRKSDFGWHRFRFSPCLKTLKRYWPYLIPFRSCISNGKPE